MSALVSTAQSAPKAGEVEDGELVRRIRRGDEHAFEVLYQRYNRRITAYIHGMVHDHARAEDVAQDVFVSALRRMRETDRPIAFKPWIYEIAKNACIDNFRRSRRTEEVSYDADEGLGAADYGRLVSAEAMPETELESKTNLDHLRGAFGGLSETHHEILVMRELEGLSYREIGERLGMSRPSVESTLFRARRRLTEEYEELVSGARCQRIQAIIAGAASAEPGARDQRRLARHISHCQPCRRQARLAGLEIPVAPDKPVRARIAALLPLPLFLRRRWLSSDSSDTVAAGSGHASSVAQWGAQFGSVVDPGWVKAAATAMTVVAAGAGAGVVGNTSTPTSPAGSFSAVVSGISSDASSRSPRTAGEIATQQRLVAAVDAAGAIAGAVYRGAVAAGGSGAQADGPARASGSGASGAGAANAGSSGGAAGTGATQAALPVDTASVPDTTGVTFSGASAANGGVGTGAGQGDSSALQKPTGSGVSAPETPNAPNVDTSVSPPPDTPAPPPTDASAPPPPDPSGAPNAGSGAAGQAGSTAGGASGAVDDAVGGATSGSGSGNLGSIVRGN